ncbi:MAG: 2-dehydro-3-deoxyglucarate aldolase [Chloroflexi bacterium]|uniref:2-dehydro-3-deoxyglucarate aldolase n=1 Tax=Candidatus Chlorohelix allophototropha TaxID=3003348 RepID=A0A8T7LZ57_9CHLR|nr:2-dehydro-3-deoxyglucarate aldolase [Chloroflexota bacterium]WJW65724.1 aldolase/citrate lyase family protein [Chloroflexota bacterium L227-S17]
MRSNFVKAKLKNGEPAIGLWHNLPGLNNARLLAYVGFDWVVVDFEHAPQNPALLTETVAAIAGAGVSAPLVRLPFNSVEWFKWSLDAGAWGVIVPMVETRQEAEQAVSWSKYPPLGTRSFGGSMACLSFSTTDRQEYLTKANDEILVALQIESAKGLANVEEILSVPGVDVAFVGPNDLHGSLGLPPSNEGAEPEFVAALEKIKAAARKYNVALGMFCSNGDTAAQRIREGFQMVNATSDASSLLTAATQNLQKARG